MLLEAHETTLRAEALEERILRWLEAVEAGLRAQNPQLENEDEDEMLLDTFDKRAQEALNNQEDDEDDEDEDDDEEEEDEDEDEDDDDDDDEDDDSMILEI
ncbi:uncharacterized protein PV07_08756 [Cladophialophora immunda]|uniref:Uncharacterized protein n=1 Tax=Cladophialophora immunda TaxID=569365 RepID=A0A0D2C559_9EURO|nr:uncharacterized protein PV07_08756 [Cladophialophora immunda]KIW25590.1 hypothetical protein PV07_08756 [Cladophialophora immunda]